MTRVIVAPERIFIFSLQTPLVEEARTGYYRNIVMKTRSLWTFPVLASCFALLGGCGGSGGKLSVPTATPVKYSISWAARSKSFSAPSSALSATLTLTKATLNGTDFVTTADRRTDPAAYSQIYTSDASVRTGAFSMTLKFYDHAGGTGDVVGTASGTATIGKDGSLIGDFAVGTAVQSVSVDTPQTVAIGATTTLSFTAKDANGAMVAVTPGSGTWTLVDGGSFVNLATDGTVTGVAEGTAHATVTVDNVTSNAVSLVVPPAVTADFANPSFEDPAIDPGSFLQAGASGWTGAVPWGIANGSGSWGSAAHTGSQYAYVQASTGEGNRQSTLEQTVDGLVVGKKYKVTFWMATRNGDVGANDPAPMTVYVDDTVILGPTTPTTSDWTAYTTDTFTATSTSMHFKFMPTLPTDFGDTADLIDDVHLAAAS